MKNDKVVLKVTGPEDNVKKFLDKIQKVYSMTLVGKILPSDNGETHCFLTVDLASEVK